MAIIYGDLGETDASLAGNPIEEEEPLDEDGFLVPISARPSGCYEQEFRIVDEMDFADLNL